MSKYEYPKLPRADIVGLLAQFQIAIVTEMDLINPNPDLILELYSRLLIHLDFLDEESEQLDFEAMSLFDNPDYHVESIRTVKLKKRIKEVLDAVECPKEFKLRDLVIPDPQRTEFFLGSILNFVLHREAKLNSITGIVVEVNNIQEQQKELEDNDIKQVKSEMAYFHEAREREAALIEEVYAKVAELRNTVTVLNKNQLSLRTTLKKLKEKTEEMDVKISNAEFTLSQNAQENESLRSKIAQSPDKVQRALEEKKLAREEARKAERLAMQTFREKTALIELYSKVYKKMSKQYKQMEAIKEQVNSLKSVEKELKALKAKLSDEEVLEKSLEVKLVERQSKVVQMEELRKQVEKECAITQEEATKYLNSKRSEAESAKRANETRKKNVEAVLTEVDAINSKLVTVKEYGAVKVEQLVRKCEEIIQAYQKYSNSIASVIESGTTTLV